MATRLATFCILLLAALPVLAEPYLAVRAGQSCGSCHTNPTGGGQRSVYGNIYSQQQIAANDSSLGEAWTGEFAQRITFGANARASATQFELDDRDDNLDFGVDRATLYLGGRVNQHVSIYLDQQVAPGGSLNREAWLKVSNNALYLKAGKLFLPFGWRLEDDSAFVREATGVTMTAGDDGIELGYETTRFNAQFAVTNGNGGAAERDDGKLFTLRAVAMTPMGQIGVSALRNDTDFDDRRAYGLFAGLRTGAIAWLLEYDRVKDRPVAASSQEQDVLLLEANWLLSKGHNLKLTLESASFDDDRDTNKRGSLVYEYSPWVYSQLRLGVRVRDGEKTSALANSEEAFVQLHVYL
ncbi:MAG: hypothetical protein ACR2PZ_16350 [Pseudomonadales bacterium]